MGKAENQQDLIKYFEDILEGVRNMGDIYLNLIKTGNVLFKNWNAIIFCDSKSLNTIKVNFGLTNSTAASSQNIIGSRKKEHTTIKSLNKTIKFLGHCYKEWLSHVNEQRDTFNELNYFRNEQIVILRMKLAEFITEFYEKTDDLDEEERAHVQRKLKSLFDLLYVLNNEVDLELLAKANYAAFNKNLDLNHDEVNNEKVEKEKNDDDEEVLSLLKELTDLGFKSKLVRKGLCCLLFTFL